MGTRACFILFLIIACQAALSQSLEKGPYTVSPVAEGVWHIEDSNSSNPAGVHYDRDGKMTGMNNCSDMYLITGGNKALLIDLSNQVKWDSTAGESLRSVVFEKSGKRELLITVTHRHGDHLGMLPAFKDDQDVRFWIPEDEFRGMTIFPDERTAYFKEGESLGLGDGYNVITLEVPGHTDHSTLFFLEGRDLVFSGDAIGSGSGVWLFNYESFLTYKKGIEKLIGYIEDPVNRINREKLVIHGGHAWQSAGTGKLTAQYIYDMRTLIGKIGDGTAETESMSAQIKFLDTNFKSGTATITWNREAAEKYRASLKKD